MYSSGVGHHATGGTEVSVLDGRRACSSKLPYVAAGCNSLVGIQATSIRACCSRGKRLAAHLMVPPQLQSYSACVWAAAAMAPVAAAGARQAQVCRLAHPHQLYWCHASRSLEPEGPCHSCCYRYCVKCACLEQTILTDDATRVAKLVNTASLHGVKWCVWTDFRMLPAYQRRQLGDATQHRRGGNPVGRELRSLRSPCKRLHAENLAAFVLKHTGLACSPRPGGTLEHGRCRPGATAA